ncbi:unnamed protein product [Effrenium voratum]|nr:unnamed protein product [Effrenium voratum]
MGSRLTAQERFENAINVVHEQNVMSPKEQDRVAGELAAPRPRRRRGRNDRGPTAKSARSPWVPAALQELEKRNFRMIENLRAAALKNIVRIPEAVPEASGQEPSDAPEEVEAEEHMAPEEAN